MNRKWVGPLVQYGAAALVGGLMAYGVASFQGYGQAQSAAEQYRILADAFTIPGLFMILIGALIWVADLGTFDSLSYSLTYAVRRLFFLGGTKPEKFYDYKERKKEKRKQRRSYRFLFVVGGVFMAVAVLFILLFYRIY